MLSSSERDVLQHQAFRSVIQALSYPGRSIPCGRDQDSVIGLVLESLWDDAARPPVFREPLDAGELLAASRGSEETPEDGATIVVAARADVMTRARLRGPGVNGALDAALPFSAPTLRARAECCANAPLGIDMIAVLEDGSVVGLPRTTSVEMSA